MTTTKLKWEQSCHKTGPTYTPSLHEKNVDIPSDYSGVIYISLEGEWKIKLARELKSCGADVDINKLI